MNLPVQTKVATAVSRNLTIRLRPYQSRIKQDIYNAWNNNCANVLAVLPTGAGKTVTFSDIIHDHKGASCAIAHRQELVAQMSLALARDKVRHRIIGPKSIVKLCVNIHMQELGASYFDPSARCAVAGVDTLVRRNGTGVEGDYYYQIISDSKVLEFGPRKSGKWPQCGFVNEVPPNALKGPDRPKSPDDALSDWMTSVTLWVQDEAHHVLKENKWGTAATMFPNAKGLGVTATPLRADGKGLGRHVDGLFDIMVEGPGMRELINKGYLTDYRIFSPESHLIMDDDDISATTGDFKHSAVVKKFRKAKNKIIGDVVKQYVKHANGKLGITFVPDVEDAIDTATAFTLAGIPAQAVSAKTPDAERIAIIRRFKNRELLMLVNVDLFGEGFDLPAIEVVIMARPTQSYALFVQQFGRALRLMIDPAIAKYWDTYTDEERRAFIAASDKPHAIIIDHVGNVQLRHGLPDAFRAWTLDRRDKRGSSAGSDVIPTRVCLNPECLCSYERVKPACPFCGTNPPEPTASTRTGPEHVDGDLIELDAATLAALRGEIAKVDMDPTEFMASTVSHWAPLGNQKRTKTHVERQEAVKALRASIGWWRAYQQGEDSEIYKTFYFKFGIDVATAQTLQTAEDFFKLAERINTHLGELENERKRNTA